MSGSEPICSPIIQAQTTQRIRALNDALRNTFSGGRVMVTRGLADAAGDQLPQVLELVRTFDAFDYRNDPHGEHDFGALEWDGETVFWKIDYYDADGEGLSPDPSDPAVTQRVLTVLLAWEY